MNAFNDGVRFVMGESAMFQMVIDQAGASPVEASASGDVLFDLGLVFSTGRDGIVDLIAAHKWFNLAALKGRADAIQLRRELAEQMSAEEVALAQRAARAWMAAY